LAAAAASLLAASASMPTARAAPSVWVIDDGEKIRRDATSTPFERGEQNPVWRPGEPVRLFGVRNEVLALQVVVEAGDAPLAAVTVDLRGLASSEGATLTIQRRFVEHFVVVRRASGGATPGESLGWEAGAGPAPGAWVGAVPDALIEIDHAPGWDPYPLRVEARTNGIVWIDLDVPRDQAPGTYRGAIDVASERGPLASIPVEVDVDSPVLPEPRAEATVFYDPDELTRRIGAGAERALWRMLHAHRVAPLHNATSAADVARQQDALTGAAYATEAGYVGPGANQGDAVLAIGAYGGLGAPDTANLVRVESIADAAAAVTSPGGADVFVYADDERCASTWGGRWRNLLGSSHDPTVRSVRVAWTCSSDPAEQPVDIPILLARYDPVQASAARSRGKEVWIYNGVLPRTGAFLLDADAISPRVNGWLAAMYGIRRWFYWESTYWYGRHGATPIDPFAEPESLHNADGDWANGDGVLVYPGRQRDAFGEHSLDTDGVAPSVRLKNWRRGLQDAAYLELARARDPTAADAVARALIPAAFDEARPGRPPAWPPRGAAFFAARKKLLAIALGRTTTASHPPPARASSRGVGWCALVLAMGLLGIYLARPLRRGITRIPRPSSQARSSIPHRAAE
jgi:hypothetical protein